MATVWRWQLGGLTFAHLGGAAAPLTIENKILLDNPDVLIIGVGGGSKVYDGKEAANIIKELSPKIVIPVQYIKESSFSECDQRSIEPFLSNMKDVEIKKVSKEFTLTSKMEDKVIVYLTP